MEVMFVGTEFYENYTLIPHDVKLEDNNHKDDPTTIRVML
jgi:hypothetical protein